MKNAFIIIILTISLNLNATVWRVNNITGVDADFSSILDAYTGALSGDTLYIEPSSGSYGDITLTKKLIIIGNGYFSSENPQTQADINTSKIGIINYNPGSEGSKIIGCHIFSIVLSTSNIVIERNYFQTSNGNGNRYCISFNANNISNFIIRNNYIENTAYDSWNGASCIYSNKNGISNLKIYNNYIYKQQSFASDQVLNISTGTSLEVFNNILNGNVYVNNVTFQNNIQITGTFSYTNGIVNNNIGNSTQFGTSNGNQQNVTMTDVFVGATGNSTDGQWQLKVGSPALGTGVGGIDCGMFGGLFPYVLSGLPPIPSIYQHSQTIDYQNQKVNVIISIKSNE